MATITKEPIDTLHEKISIKLDKTDYLPSFEKSLKEYGKKANIQGFRPGKVPAGLIKKMYGSSLFAEEVFRLVEKELTQFLETEKTDIFAQPLPLETDAQKLDMNNPGEYLFNFEIGLKPEFELADLSKLNITAYNIDITEKMIDEEVEQLQQRNGHMNDKELVDDNPQTYLDLTFDELIVEAEAGPAEEDNKKNNSLQLSYFTEAFRKEIIGKKAGDSFTMNIEDAIVEERKAFLFSTLGLDTDNEADRKKTFKLTITAIRELEKRELNEELFLQLYPDGNVKTEEELRAKLKEDTFSFWATQSRSQIDHQIFHELTENTKIDFPEQFLRRWLVKQGDSEQSTQQPKSEEQITKEMPSFLNKLKWTLISDKIVKEQQIEVSADEIRAGLKERILGYLKNSPYPFDEDSEFVNDYINRGMKDSKYIEEAYGNLQSQKIFDWAEKQIKPTSQSISAEEFSKMVQEHHH